MPSLPARIVEHPSSVARNQDFIEAFSDAFALHGVPSRWHEQLPIYRKILDQYPPEILRAAILEALAHVKWFPKVPEIKIHADYLMEHRKVVTCRDVEHAVADAYGIEFIQLLANRRKYAKERQVALYLCRQLTPQSLPQIGRFFRLDHTTVMYACRVVAERLRSEPELRNKIEAIERALLS
jgi:hypothetical protein